MEKKDKTNNIKKIHIKHNTKGGDEQNGEEVACDDGQEVRGQSHHHND
jgi:hypothetical protein